jgi:hypothetical protein
MALFGITRRKLEEGFGSLVGNVGQLFNNIGGAVNSVVQPAVRNVQQQVQPVANQVAQNWQQAQNASGSFGNTLRQQAQQLTNNAINATVREVDTAAKDPASYISGKADSLGYSREDQFKDVQRLRSGDLSSLANPLTKGAFKGLQAVDSPSAGVRNYLATEAPTLPLKVGGGLVELQDNLARPFRTAGMQSAGRDQEYIDRANKRYTDTALAQQKYALDNSRAYTDIVNRTPYIGEQDNIGFKLGKGAASVGQYAALSAAGSPALASSVAGFQQYGNTAQESYDKTGRVSQAGAVQDALMQAATEGLTEKIPGISKPGVVGQGLRGVAKNAIKGFGVEGGQEALQQFGSNVIAKRNFDKDRELSAGVLEAGLIGGVLGGGVGGVAGSVDTRKSSFTKSLDDQLESLNNSVNLPGNSNLEGNINEPINANVNEPVQQPQAPQPTQTLQVPQDSQLPQPVQQPQVTQPMSEVDTQQLQNTQADITRNQPLSGQPESASDLLNRYKVPEQNTQAQQALGEAQVQAQDLVSLYKLDPSTAQRLVNDYGYDKVAALAQEVSKSGTARNISAVVVSEAQKRWGKPKQMSDAELASLAQTPEAQANTVSEQPTQTVPSEQQPILDAEAQAYVANTPQVGKTDPLEALKAEARKYKSADEYANSLTPQQIKAIKQAYPNKGLLDAVETVYGKRIAKANTTTLDTLNPTGGLYTDYTPQKRATMPLGENIKTLANTTGKNPDEIVTIYRGAPKSQKAINAGDYITTDPELAKTYTNGNVISKKVRLGDILDDVTEPGGGEYIYRPNQANTPQVGKTGNTNWDQIAEEVQAMEDAGISTEQIDKAVDRMATDPSLGFSGTPENSNTTQKSNNVVDTSTGESMAKDQYIGKATQAMQTIIDTQILPKFEGQPFTVEQFTREIQEADRNGTNPSPAVAAFYNRNIAPLVKGLAKNIGREDVLQRKWYLPQFRPGIDQKINVGGSLVNQIDVQDFGFSKARENAIPLEELDYTLDGLVRLATQEAAYKARHAIRAEEIVQTQADRGIEIAPKQAEKVAKLEEQTAKDLNQKSNREDRPTKQDETAR